MCIRDSFWNRFIGQFEFNGIHAAYEPELDKFVCPDGSHLDVRDRAAFTKALSKGLAVRGVGIK